MVGGCAGNSDQASGSDNPPDNSTASNILSRPLVFEDLHYLGAFRLPGGAGFEHARFPPIAINARPDGSTTAFVACQGKKIGEVTIPQIAEVTIPEPVNGAIGTLNQATFLQQCADPTAGHTIDIPNTNGLVLGGLLVHQGKLITSMYKYYDASTAPVRAFFVKPDTALSAPNAVGAFMTQNPGPADSADGWMAPVPKEWQQALRGPVASGNCCTAVVSRTSFGPAAHTLDPAQFTDLNTPVSTTGLLYYPEAHQELGHWDYVFDGVNVLWNNTPYPGAVIPDIGQSILFFGSQGMAKTWCYGCGSTIAHAPDDWCVAPTPPTSTDPGFAGVPFCHDPADDEGKGPHMFPYRFQIMAYNLNDLAAVAAGTRTPYSLRPYAIWSLADGLVGSDGQFDHHAGGVAYDPARRRIYFVAAMKDENRPLVHVWRVGPEK
jgi:hypothetical protein